MRHKTLATETITADLGEFVAIAATWSVDRDGDQILRGAFRRTIAQWQSSGKRIPVAWNHSGEAANIIGYVDPHSMRETSQGLYVEGKLDLDESEVARQAWRSMKAGTISLSFGFLATQEREREDGTRELLEIDLFEISAVSAPSNPDTRFVELKNAEHVRDFNLHFPTRHQMKRRAEQRAKAEREQKRARPIHIKSFEC